MKKQFKISVPKPCHEDWSKMTPKEKGRFCQSCAKTVVDFTKKSKEEVQEYLSENFGKSVCGHFRREQLDTVTLEIPASAFHQNLSFQKLFLLTLLLVMGTTLFSCQNSNGKKQKIEDVILIDSVSSVAKEIDSLHHVTSRQPKDTVQHDTLRKVPYIKQPDFPTPPLTGIVLTDSDLKTKEQMEKEKEEQKNYYVFGRTRFSNSETLSRSTFMNHDINWREAVHIDSIIEMEEEEEIIEDVPYVNVYDPLKLDITGDVISEVEEVVDGEVEILVLGGIEPYEEEVEEFDTVLGYIIEESPKFPESNSLKGTKAREDFNQKIQLFFDEHFQIPKENLGVSQDRYRIFAQFEIDTLGQIQVIKIRAPHPLLTKETERILKKLPTFIPGKQRGKVVNTRYTLPLFIDLKD